MHFDWYQATIPEHPLSVVDAVLNRLAPGGQVEEGRGRHNYHQAFTVRDRQGDRVALVLAGGNNGAHPNAAASGAAAAGFAGLVREAWPMHQVSRFDVAEDFCEPGAFEAAEAVCREVARERGISGRAIVPDDPSEGRTYYMGAKTSDVRVRLYDKTAETRARLAPERHAEIPDNWARLEVQVRPRKEGRLVAAHVSPEQAWGFSGWTHELAQRAFALQVERITMQAGRETDHERAYRFMLRQYGNVLRQMFADLGGWDCVGRTIGDDLARIDDLHR